MANPHEIQSDSVIVDIQQKSKYNSLPYVLFIAGLGPDASTHVLSTIRNYSEFSDKMEVSTTHSADCDLTHQNDDMLDCKTNTMVGSPIRSCILVKYHSSIKQYQNEVAGKDHAAECMLYCQLAKHIANVLIQKGITEIDVIAKSAGAAIALYIPSTIKIRVMNILAPAPVVDIRDAQITPRDISIMLGWSTLDPKISFTNHDNMLKLLSIKYREVIDHTFTTATPTHDFTVDFVEPAIKRIMTY